MIAVRNANVDDYDAYAALFGELGVDDPRPSRERFAAELVARIAVAIEHTGANADRVVGYVLVEQLAEVGYIRNVVTDPTRRRAGIGRALMAHARDRFVAAGASTWCLNVKPTNTAAIALYTRCGMAPAYRSSALRIPSDVSLAPPPPDLVFSDLPAERDAELEPAFGLLRGQLASARSRPSRRVVQLARGEVPGVEVLGVGVFSSSIPGAFPFRLTAPSLAGAFVAHLRTSCPPDAAFLQVGVEDDRPLHDAVIALGGRVHLEILHMRGSIR